MVRGQQAPSYRKELVEHGFGFRIFFLSPVELRHIVHDGQRVRMLLTQDSASSLKRLAEEWRGFRIPGLRLVQQREAPDAGQCFLMLLTEHTPPHLQGRRQKSLRLSIFALVTVYDPKAGHAH